MLNVCETHVRWRFNKNNCRVATGLMNCVWLEDCSKLPFDTMQVGILYIFLVQKYTTKKCYAKELSMSAAAIKDWNNFVHCTDLLLKNQWQIGGVNKTGGN